MIIQVRGTSGSGKTTVVQRVMAAYAEQAPWEVGTPWKPVYVDGRKKPLYYQGRNGVVVLGHYETACGGCDTVGSAPKVFDLICNLPKSRYVVSEGLLWSEDVKWTKELVARGNSVLAIFLATPPELCLERVQQRQKEKGKPPADAARVKRKLERRVYTIDSARRRLSLEAPAELMVRRYSVRQATRTILDLLLRG